MIIVGYLILTFGAFMLACENLKDLSLGSVKSLILRVKFTFYPIPEQYQMNKISQKFDFSDFFSIRRIK